MSWGTPDTEMLVDFMVFKLRWDPSYVRKMLLPMLSTIYLRERARNNLEKSLLYDQYEFHSIKCIKTRFGHQSFVVRWRKPISSSGLIHREGEEATVWEDEMIEDDESVDPLDELNEPQVQDDKGDLFLLTDECIGLVQSAFPDEAERFLHEKKLQESKRNNVVTEEASSSSRSATPGVQKSITDFYRTTKATPAQSAETGGSLKVPSSASGEKKKRATSTSHNIVK